MELQKKRIDILKTTRALLFLGWVPKYVWQFIRLFACLLESSNVVLHIRNYIVMLLTTSCLKSLGVLALFYYVNDI
jgi:hypothetical protein